MNNFILILLLYFTCSSTLVKGQSIEQQPVDTSTAPYETTDTIPMTIITTFQYDTHVVTEETQSSDTVLPDEIVPTESTTLITPTKNNEYETPEKTQIPVTTTVVPNKTVSSTSSTPVTPPASIIDPYQIVQEKCIEYTRARYVNRTLSGLSENDSMRISSKIDCVRVFELAIGEYYLTKPKEFPHMALIGYEVTLGNLTWDCDGSLISERYVLSAAHCSAGKLGEARWVRLGELIVDSDVDGNHHKDYAIVKRIIHPEYKASLLYNDIALFKLNTDVEFNPYMRPACLDVSSLLAPDIKNRILITGWGYSIRAGKRKTDTYLLKDKIHLLNDNQCKTLYADDEKMKQGYSTESMLCSKDELSSIEDICGGHSGGAVQIPTVGYSCMWSQIGIAAQGGTFCEGNKTSVFTKVAHFIPWIQNIVWP